MSQILPADSLAYQEQFGITEIDEWRPRYEVVSSKAPRRVVRAVNLVNWGDTVLSSHSGFETPEDRPVRRARTWAFVLLVLALYVPLGAYLASRLRAVGFRDLALTAAVAVVIVLLHTGLQVLFGLFRSEPLTDVVASRVFGVPARPRLYVRRAVARGWVREMPD